MMLIIIFAYSVILITLSCWIGHIIGCLMSRRFARKKYGEEMAIYLKKKFPMWKFWVLFQKKKGDGS